MQTHFPTQEMKEMSTEWRQPPRPSDAPDDDLAEFVPVVVDVLVEPTEPGDPYPGIVVHPIWAVPDGPPLDRPDTGGWQVNTRAQAQRLERACRAGAAFSSAYVKRDNAGATYVRAPHTVLGRYLNADLKRLGF